MKKCKKKLHEYNETEYNSCPECRKISSRRHHEKRIQQSGYLEYHKQRQKMSYDKNKDLSESRLWQRGNRLKKLYWPKLNCWQALAEYNKLLAEQRYCCKICEVHQEEYQKNFHVDHDHSTLEVRGLLCTVCNRHVIGGIDIRIRAKKVKITLDTMLKNIHNYYEYKRKIK